MERLSDERAEKLRDYVDRVLALHSQVNAKKLAVRAVYAELKDVGYDKTSVGKIIAYLRLPADKRADIDARQHMAVSMPLREWPTDLMSLPSLRSRFATE